MPRTKKVSMTGRFGTRYGTKLRRVVLRIEEIQRKWHKCPKCETPRVKRVAVGIWKCRFCNFTFAGGAYMPITSKGKTADRTAKRLSQSKEMF